MPAGRPKHPDSFPFRDLTDDEFDELVYLLAHVVDSRVLKLRAPDGGLDTVLPVESDRSRAEWGIQAKLHREHIKWASCKESLDRAVDVWQASRVTFAFPRDLTANQHRNFVRHLDGRIPGVEVDWWGSTKLTALMTSGEEGRLVAKRFFHAEDPADIVDRASRAGGPLRTPTDVLDRYGAIGDFLRASDPHFEYKAVVRPRSGDEAPRTPNAVMRLEFSRGDEQLFVDAVPRTPSAAEHYGPRGAMRFDDAERAVALLRKVQSLGGRATLGHANVRFERIPAPFDQMLTEIDGMVTVRAEAEATPLASTVIVDTETGNASVDFDLIPEQPEQEWDAKLVGRRHGITLELRFVFRHDVASGRLEITWRLDRPSGSASERLTALNFVVGLHGRGTFAVSDREGRLAPVTQSTESRTVPAGLSELRGVYRDIVDIEDFAGTSLAPLPDDFTGEDAYHLAYLAELVRRQRVDGTVTSGTMEVGAEALRQFRRTGSDIEIRSKLIARLFGRAVYVADQILRLPPMQVQSAIRRSSGLWLVRLVPASGRSGRMDVEYRRPQHGDSERSV